MGERRPMPHVTVVKPIGPPELSFVRSSMQALEGGRRGCEHCHRTPLLGETIYLYGERFVCELCRPLRREAPGGGGCGPRADRAHRGGRFFAAKGGGAGGGGNASR